jgi:uncharacterized membrane protein
MSQPTSTQTRPLSLALTRGKKLLASKRALVVAESIEVERTITIRQPSEVLYAYFRDPRHLRAIMGEFAEVSGEGDHLYWTVNGPLKKKLRWTTIFVEERPGEILRWQSASDTILKNDGSISFGPELGEWGTAVTLRMRFELPVKVAGPLSSKLLHALPEVGARAALRRLKSLAETGEIPTTEQNPAGRNGGRAR